MGQEVMLGTSPSSIDWAGTALGQAEPPVRVRSRSRQIKLVGAMQPVEQDPQPSVQGVADGGQPLAIS